MSGGLAWGVKGGVILATGVQPPVIYEVAQPLFAFGLVGLYFVVRDRSPRVGVAGVSLAFLTVAAWMSTLIWSAISPAPSLNGEEFVWPTSFTLLVTGFAPIGGLVLLGMASLRAGALRQPWRAIPLALGLLYVPMLGLGAALSTFNERYLEIGLVVIALGWIALGYALLAKRP